METSLNILNAAKVVGYSILSVGIAIFLYGFFVSDNNIATSIGIGTVMGAIFIFLIGVFFVATDEMEKKTDKGIKFSLEKGVPFRHSL